MYVAHRVRNHMLRTMYDIMIILYVEVQKPGHYSTQNLNFTFYTLILKVSNKYIHLVIFKILKKTLVFYTCDLA